jgi:transposase-like protein
MNKLSTEDRFNHLIAVSSLNDTQISAYCRQHGIFKFQLNNWKESFMSTSQNHKNRENMSELKLLRAENKKLKQELNRKESALAEAAALLVLQKKTALIWGAKEED